jgi:hypothetical protein
MNPDEKVTYFAETDFRNKRTKFGIKAKDRSRHMYVIGMTGMGKSTMLENLAIQDIQSGEGIGFIDPHGGTAEKLLSYVPEHRIKDVVYFAPFDTEYPIAFNVLDQVDPNRRHLVVGGLMSAFKKIWVDAFSGRMEYILTMTLLALTEYPGATLLGVNRMYSDKDFRRRVVEHVTDPSVRSFWLDEYAKYDPKFATEATAAIQNKVGQFTGNPLIRNLVGQSQSSFDIREIMDNRKILIINLSKGRVGEDNANLIGSMMITKMYLAAMSRADVPESEMRYLPAFNFFVDEFQSFASDSFANILSEARKYKLNLTIAHQYVEQMSDQVKAAVFGNVGTMVTFRVGSTDAEIFEKEFAPFFMLEDIVSLSQRQIYLRLMIDGVGSQPFSAITLPPIQLPEQTFKERVIASSRLLYAHNKHEVAEAIKVWHEPVTLTDAEKEKIRQESLEKKGIPHKENYSQAAQKNTFQAPAKKTFSQPLRTSPAPSTHSQNTTTFTVPRTASQKDTQHITEQQKIPSQSTSLPHSSSLKDALRTQGLTGTPQKTQTQYVPRQVPHTARVSLSTLLSKEKQVSSHTQKIENKEMLRDVAARAAQQVSRPEDVPSSRPQTTQSSPPVQQTAPVSSTVSQNTEIPTHILKKILE